MIRDCLDSCRLDGLNCQMRQETVSVQKIPAGLVIELDGAQSNDIPWQNMSHLEVLQNLFNVGGHGNSRLALTRSNDGDGECTGRTRATCLTGHFKC